MSIGLFSDKCDNCGRKISKFDSERKIVIKGVVACSLKCSLELLDQIVDIANKIQGYDTSLTIRHKAC